MGVLVNFGRRFISEPPVVLECSSLGDTQIATHAGLFLLQNCGMARDALCGEIAI